MYIDLPTTFDTCLILLGLDPRCPATVARRAPCNARDDQKDQKPVQEEAITYTVVNLSDREAREVRQRLIFYSRDSRGSGQRAGLRPLS
jgi:hypothetical protein